MNDTGGPVEQILNTITHAIGAGLSIAGLAIMLVLCSYNPAPVKYVSYSVYGATQIFLYLSSTFTHGFAAYPAVRNVLRRLDFSAIYLLIAGTYTPAALVVLRGFWGWLIFGIIWGLAIIGILVRNLAFDRLGKLADMLYLPMGLSVLIVLRPLLRRVSFEFFIWIIIGGLAYSLGMIFYFRKNRKFSHTIWHLFVLTGSISFFLAYTIYYL